MDREKVIQALDDSLKNQHCGFVDGVGDVYAVSEETIKDILELLKWQQQKKAELLKQFDKEIEWAEQARIDSACEGENAWVEHYACQKRDYEHAKSIIANVL